MQTIKIGRSSSNDVILNDTTVSHIHAELIVLDQTGSKSYTLKDLNSLNGTFVNGIKISSAVSIKPTDSLKFGNYITNLYALLNNNKTRVIPNNNISVYSDIESEKKIGRTKQHPVNDIILPYNDVSSSHAVLMKKKNGEVVIVDKGSTNGTYVNGVKVSHSILKSGDRVYIANKYLLQWENIYPPVNTVKPKKIRQIWISATVSVVSLLLVSLILWWAPWKPWEPGKVAKPEEIYSYYNKSIVLIYQSYYFEVSANGEILGQFVFNQDNEVVPLSEAGYPMGGFGTGFFVSDNGIIMTNRHVMNPYMVEKAHLQQLKQYFEISLEQYASSLQRKYPNEAAIYRNAANNISVSIQVYQTGVAPNDTYVSSISDFLPCTILGDTGSDEVDLCLIQLNSKRLPEGTECYVNTDIIDLSITEGKSIYTIGFPQALAIGTTTLGVEAQKQSGQISQLRGNIQFGHNLNIDHGSSGSPIFSERGHLIGIVNAGFLESAGNFNIGIQAKHAKELINKYK